MLYKEELTRAMTWLGQKKDTVFIGQAVGCPGTGMYSTLLNVPDHKKIEFPVNEDMQMGMSIGLALNKIVPISIFPRWNFLLLGTNQLANHLDKIPIISEYQPRVIVRTSIGSEKPLHPQYQHVGDYTDAFKLMCKNINIVRLDEPEQIFDAYCLAYERDDRKSTIIVEWGDYYNEK